MDLYRAAYRIMDLLCTAKYFSIHALISMKEHSFHWDLCSMQYKRRRKRIILSLPTMNKTTNNTLRIWLKEDLSGVVGTLDHWSQGGPTTDNIFMRSKQYYTTTGDRRLPEPELPDKLMRTRQYLLAPGQPCK